ncbi:MAG: hypothetical protein ACYDB2_09975 [Acidimicrobiales bacterium]
MSKGGRLATVLGLFLVSIGLVVWGVSTLITPGVPGGVVNFTNTQAAGQPVNMTVQTVGSIGFGSHPTWVSYLVKDPATGKWVHDTSWKLPANTVIHMTVDQFDSGSPLRNQEWGQVQGVIGGSAQLNGASLTVFNSNTGAGVAHTFTIPALNLSVPLVSVTGTPCAAAPCQLGANPHNIETFSFKTPGPGTYNWQCFVPCGLGYLFGNGGPMSTQNYMGGVLEVVQ